MLRIYESHFGAGISPPPEEEPTAEKRGSQLRKATPDKMQRIARALNENAIVYDGKLVVNAIFQSNDPAVMAAGSVTKFSRRYGAQLPVSCYNSREVGAALGLRATTGRAQCFPHPQAAPLLGLGNAARPEILEGDLGGSH